MRDEPMEIEDTLDETVLEIGEALVLREVRFESSSEGAVKREAARASSSPM